MDFSSDNSFGVHPAIMEAMARANGGSVPSYGDDTLTADVTGQFQDIFETDLDVFLVPTGTAGNALSVATFCPPFGSMFAHGEAHLVIEECGAAEFFTSGGKVVPIDGQNGQIDPQALKDSLAHGDTYGTRTPAPSVLTLTQTTECGTVYRPEAIAELAQIARGRNMAVHLDGARFANAVASLGCAPADISWRAGVDIMTFGATKNGAMAVEAILLFDRKKRDELERRRMRSGHLLSKGRYLASQLDAYFKDNLWLQMAAHANAMATRLAAGLTALPGVRLAWPADGNEVFAILPVGLCDHLENRGARFYSWSARGLSSARAPGDGEDLRRMICSFDTPEKSVDAFIDAAGEFTGHS